MALDVNKIINVVNVIENVPVDTRTFGKGLILTTGDSTSEDRVRVYGDLDGVLEDFGSNTEVYGMARTYFANGWYGTPEYLYVGIYDSAEDASLEAALSAIADTQQDFYVFLPDTNFDGTQRVAIDAWVNASSIAYRVGFNDVNTDTIDSGVETDLASLLKASGSERGFVCYETAANEDYPIMALAGMLATVDFTTSKPAITLANKRMTNVVGEDLTTGEYLAMDGKNCAYFTEIKSKGLSLTHNTVASDGRAIDVLQTTDYIKEIMTNALLNDIANRGKIPFTQKGIDIVKGILVKVSNQFLSAGIIGDGVDGQTGELLPTGYKITIPTISEISSVDKANRELNGVSVRYLLAGAIETIDVTNYIQL